MLQGITNAHAIADKHNEAAACNAAAASGVLTIRNGTVKAEALIATFRDADRLSREALSASAVISYPEDGVSAIKHGLLAVQHALILVNQLPHSSDQRRSLHAALSCFHSGAALAIMAEANQAILEGIKQSLDGLQHLPFDHLKGRDS